MHRRETIADAVRAALQAQFDSVPIALTVTIGRVYPNDRETMPAVNVSIGAEAVIDDGDMASDPDQLRSLEVDVEIWVMVIDGQIDARADDVALEVERALGPGLSAAIVDRLIFVGSEPVERDFLEAPVEIRTLTYRADYLVDRTNPV